MRNKRFFNFVSAIFLQIRSIFVEEDTGRCNSGLGANLASCLVLVCQLEALQLLFEPYIIVTYRTI